MGKLWGSEWYRFRSVLLFADMAMCYTDGAQTLFQTRFVINKRPV